MLPHMEVLCVYGRITILKYRQIAIQFEKNYNGDWVLKTG